MRAAALLLLPMVATGCVLQQQARPTQPEGEPAADSAQPARADYAPAAPSATRTVQREPSPEERVRMARTAKRLSNLTAELNEPIALSDGDAEPTQAARAPATTDIWDRIRDGLRLSDYDHPRVQEFIAWYTRHQEYLDRVADRARPYLHLIVEEVEARGLPMEIALLPVVESAFQPFAYSHGRAAGLWQFIPGTARRFGLEQNWWYDGRRDVPAATRAALDYLEYLHERLDGDWLNALASYNSGEGTVLKAIARNRRRGRPADFWHLGLPRETRSYVPQLLALAAVVQDPQAHGLRLQPIANEPQLAEVDVGSQIDLSLAAELAGLSIKELYRYNPGFNRWATNPEGPHHLLVPIDKAEDFRKALDDHPPKQRIKWVRHRIRSGESLLALAKRYRTSVDLLREVNELRGNLIRAGDTMLIPVARKRLDSYRLSADQRRQAKQNKERAGDKVRHTVRRGDTLWEIARHYRVGVRKLAGWNAMAPTDPLLPGQELVVWTEQAPRQQAKATRAVFTHPNEGTRRRIGYTVRSGDSLWRISNRFRVSVNDLRRWNDLGSQKYLQPGQRLTLYVDVTRQSGNI